MIFLLFIQNQWMILVGKLMCLTINFQKTRLKSTFDIKIKFTERTVVNKTVESFAAPITKASCFIRWLWHKMERVSRMNAPLDLTGQLGAFLMKKEVARGATVARTPYRSLASRANN
jgi:hypothetical protein